MRHLDDSIWRDEWFSEQAVTGRLLWIGIITHAADDQGRFLDNSALVRSDVFPMDPIAADEIELWLTKFVGDKKLIRYESGGKKLLQVANWWKYQDGAQWMGKSKYMAPDGWTDFWRFHAKGDRNKIEVSPSWAKRSEVSTSLGSQVDTSLSNSDLNSDIDTDIDIQEEEVPQNFDFSPELVQALTDGEIFVSVWPLVSAQLANGWTETDILALLAWMRDTKGSPGRFPKRIQEGTKAPAKYYPLPQPAHVDEEPGQGAAPILAPGWWSNLLSTSLPPATDRKCKAILEGAQVSVSPVDATVTVKCQDAEVIEARFGRVLGNGLRGVFPDQKTYALRIVSAEMEPA